MTTNEPKNKENSNVNFSMKMSDWFIDDLTVEEKKEFINRIKTKDINFRELTYDELRKKKFWVKKT